MKTPTFEQQIIAARPHDTPVNKQFTDRVMATLPDREIIANVLRKTNVKPKETFIMKLRTLHKPALVAIAASSLFALAGTAYAIYALWLQPEVTTTGIGASAGGRSEVSVLLQNCGPDSGNKSYEIKDGSTTTPQLAAQVIQAQCELQAIEGWLREQTTGLNEYSPNPSDDVITIGSPMPFRVISVSGNELRLEASDKRKLTVSSNVKIVIGDNYGTLAELQPGDVVTIGEKLTYRAKKQPDGRFDTSGSPDVRELLAIIRLDLPYEAYAPGARMSLAERRPCINNEADSCVQSGGVDLYMASATAGSEGREFQGKLVTYDAISITLQGSSGKTITFVFDMDIVGDYNKNRASQHYQGVVVKTGDMMAIRYKEEPDQHALTIARNQIIHAQYMIEVLEKTDPIKKY